MAYALKPLKVGGILDQAILVFKDNFGLYLKIMFCLQIPVGIVTEVIVTQKMPVAAPHPSPEELTELLQAQATFLFTVALPMVILTGLFVTPLVSAVLIQASGRLYLGRPAGLRPAFGTAFGRAHSLIWTWSLIYFFTVGGFFLCVLPGILVTFWFALAPTVAVLEGTSGMTALKRSWYLMRSAGNEHYLTFFLLGILVGAINAGIGVGSAFILEQHLAGLVSAVLQGVTGAFTWIAAVVFYFSCRARAENFDLVQLAKEVAAAPIGPLPAREQG